MSRIQAACQGIRRVPSGGIGECRTSKLNSRFASFIIGKDAIFSQLTSGFMEEMGQLHTANLTTGQLQTQQIALSEKYEQLSDKVNAQFNQQFVANL
ncbi:hypothetical protein A7D03_21605 [Aeromonas salmonicida]|nr:hypothetical protein A7D03_21605 [Aeromonas salmonicida]